MSKKPKSQPRHTATLPLVKRLAGNYLRPYLGMVLLASVLIAINAGSSAVLAQKLVPLIDEVLSGKNPGYLRTFAVIVFATFVVRGFSGYFSAVLMNNVGQRLVAALQKQLYNHLIKADLAYLHSLPSGQLVSSLVNDVNQVRQGTAEVLTNYGQSVLTLIFLVGVMFQQDWLLATISLTVVPFTTLMLSRMTGRLRRVAGRTQAALGTFASILTQTFQGARHVKAYGMEEYEMRRVAGIADDLRKLTNKSFRVSSSLIPINEVLSGVIFVGVIIYGGLEAAAGHSTAGTLTSFTGAFLLAFEPLKRLSKLQTQLQVSLASAERVFALLDTPPRIIDRPGAAELAVASHAIKFNDVRFAYQDGTVALDGVSLEVPAGKTVALVGSSGSGKTTILNLIPRFYDVTGGSVTLGGQDIRDVTLASLRSAIGLVSQETGLFDDTVRGNIAYGRVGATQEEIEAAAKAAAAHDFILGLPQGYDTRVGENGVKLSGGQRQRIAIARAMLKNAPVLLLDEATSALDSESERLVQDALRRLQQGRTTLVIAHRLSTIIDADRIYVIDGGRVVESGTHDELLALDGAYARFHALQAGGGPGAVAELGAAPVTAAGALSAAG
ncbi:subfamily B ATP-binding cassette protein MsbA [Nitrospirillum amazonense]|uniref:Subfamily B ATP-binding cassette protein MsbA n=1 Tax=Nitrospirillum amazonense TaxID=28077 RepID=A0A560KGL6_9PROT|nr:ABC transporter ATP-binding protein [Nitrospirillum amazonense]TWB82441.1 subfamily B ATP-binding cassette protein MsbA [Nitrospirillum amazonense]